MTSRLFVDSKYSRWMNVMCGGVQHFPAGMESKVIHPRGDCGCRRSRGLLSLDLLPCEEHIEC